MIAIGLFLLKLKAIFLMVLQFCIDNWKIVLPIILLFVALYAYNKQVKRAVKAEAQIAEYKVQVKSMAETLQESAFAIQKSNNLIEAWKNKAKNAQKAAAEAKVEAARANTINNNKKTAIEAKINIHKPDTCEAAIDEVKALLK